jgi:hypothetical protein
MSDSQMTTETKLSKSEVVNLLLKMQEDYLNLVEFKATNLCFYLKCEAGYKAVTDILNEINHCEWYEAEEKK